MADGPTASEVFAAARARQDSSGGGGSGGGGGGGGDDDSGGGGSGGGGGGGDDDPPSRADAGGIFAGDASGDPVDSGGDGTGPPSGDVQRGTAPDTQEGSAPPGTGPPAADVRRGTAPDPTDSSGGGSSGSGDGSGTDRQTSQPPGAGAASNQQSAEDDDVDFGERFGGFGADDGDSGFGGEFGGGGSDDSDGGVANRFVEVDETEPDDGGREIEASAFSVAELDRQDDSDGSGGPAPGSEETGGSEQSVTESSQPPGAGPATLEAAEEDVPTFGQDTPEGADQAIADQPDASDDTLPGGAPDAGETITQPDAERPDSIESREDVAQLAEFRIEQELGQNVKQEDINVQSQGVKDGQRQFSAELTDQARQELAAERTEGVTEGDISVAADGELTLKRPVAASDPGSETSSGPAAEPPIEQQASRTQARREQVVEQVEEQAQEQVLGAPGAAAVDIAERATGRELIDFEAGTDVALDQQAGQIRAELTDRRRRQIVTDTIEGQLEAETGASLDDEDIRVEEGDGGALVGRLSEEGQKTVAVQNNPFTDAPVIGGAVETGVRARQEFIDVTDPVAEDFREATPSKREFIGGLAAAAPVAAAEPTPFGELGLGAVAAGGAAVLGGAALADAARGNEPTARERSELDIGQVSVPELETPDDTADSGELQPGDRQVSELEPGARAGSELSVPTDTGRDVTTLVTGEQVGQQRQKRERPAPSEPTITREDIRGDIGEPEQRGPSIREQQRRDDLTPPERRFPTGESAVVGRGTAEETSDDLVERQQEAQRSELLDEEGRADGAEELAPSIDQQPRQDVRPGARADAATQTALDIDQQADQALETPQITQPELGTQGSTAVRQPFEQRFEQRFAEPVEAQVGESISTSPATVDVTARTKRRLPRELPPTDNRRPDDEQFDGDLFDTKTVFDVVEPGEIAERLDLDTGGDR